jgi:hypothetical protein
LAEKPAKTTKNPKNRGFKVKSLKNPRKQPNLAILGGYPQKPPKIVKNRQKWGILRTPPKKGVILGGVPPKSQKMANFLKKAKKGVQKFPGKAGVKRPQNRPFSKMTPNFPGKAGVKKHPF